MARGGGGGGAQLPTTTNARYMQVERAPGERARGGVEMQPLAAKVDSVGAEDYAHDPHHPDSGVVRRAGIMDYLHHEGGWLLASSHIITAIIGAGVLGLPYAISWLGWPAGLTLLVVFFVISAGSAFMLADVYEVGGRKHPTYRHAVLHILGKRDAAVLSVLQYLNLVLCGIGYTVAAGQSIKMVIDTYCTRSQFGHCNDPIWETALAFGASQLLFSQMPSLEEAWWSSAVGAAMSIVYSTLALGLSISHADGSKATTTGRSAPAGEKVFGIFNALGSIAFAYNFQTVLLEVQHTLHEPPAAVVSMRKAVGVGLGCSFGFYVAVGLAGYAALGDAVPGDILTGFSGPAWAVNLANVAVLVHMVSAYQVFSQPVFQALESALTEHNKLAARAPPLALRLVNRSLYVCFTTAVACAMPFFSDIIGLIGALVFWPATVYMPIKMWVKVYEPSRGVRRAFDAASAVCLLVSAVALVGAVQNIVVDSRSYAMFGGRR